MKLRQPSIGQKADLLTILDQLDAAALADGGVWLLRLNSNLLHDDALSVRRATKRIALVLRSKISLLVILVCPQLTPTAIAHLTSTANSSWLVAASHGGRFECCFP